MTYGEILRELHIRSGRSVKETAALCEYEPEHLSAILHGKQPGSWKGVLTYLRNANIDPQQILWLDQHGHSRSRLVTDVIAIVERRDRFTDLLVEFVAFLKFRAARVAREEKAHPESALRIRQSK